MCPPAKRHTRSGWDTANKIASSLCLVLTCVLLTRVWAAAPATGSIASVGSVLRWAGTEPASGADSATNPNETMCIDTPGPTQNCDTFTLTIASGAYGNTALRIALNWTLPTDEYDLFVHQNNLNGAVVASSTNGPNGNTNVVTQNVVTIPLPNGGNVLTPITYAVHAVNAIGPPNDQYVGTASLTATTANRTATYTKGGFTFSNDVPLKAPVTVSDGEPSSRTDTKGNFYVSGIRGFPAGVDLWYFDLNPASPTYDPLMQFPQYRGQPDGFTGQASEQAGINAGGDGGGDIDLAVTSNGTLAFASLIAANLSTGATTDMGMNYTLNPVGNATGGIPANDRQWLEAFGPNSVYILYRTLDPVVSQIQRSDATAATANSVAVPAGVVYGPAATTGISAQTASLDVDPTDGTVIAGFNDGTIAVGTPPIDPTTSMPSTTLAPLSGSYVTHVAATDPAGVAHIFFQCQVAHDAGTGPGKNGLPYGTLYALYSNDTDVMLTHSLDRGATWSAPVRVNDAATVATPSVPGGPIFNIFPRLALGTTFGSVGIVWYGTDNVQGTGGRVSSNSRGGPAAMWTVYYALTYNATAVVPNFMEQRLSNHFNHAGNISEGGLVVTGANPNRNLLDYFEVSFDPKGAAVVGYTDDHSDFSGECFAVRQTGGPSIVPGVVVPTPQEGPKAAPQSAPAAYVTSLIPGPFGAQVTDFVGDESYGLVATAPATDPVDITAIAYYAVQGGRGPQLVAKMTVSNLTAIGGSVPPTTTWRMNFAANCPNAGIDPTGQYSFGMSDLGDQFYLEADTSASGAQTASWGTVVRNSDGSLTYTKVANADFATFDPARNTISVGVTVADLNHYLGTHNRPLINRRTILSGLRGQAFDTSGIAKEDSTYGGTQFLFPYKVF